MTTDNRTSEPTIEAVAQVIYDHSAVNDEGNICQCGHETGHDLAFHQAERLHAAGRLAGAVTEAQVEAAWQSLLETATDVTTREDMRAAFVAAAGFAPQAESVPTSTYINPHLPGMIRNLRKSDPSENSVRTALKLAGDLIQELIDLRAAPAQPSSTDLDAFNKWHEAWWRNEPDPIAESNAREAFYAGWDGRGAPGTVDEDALAEEIGRHKLVHVSVSRKSAFCMCNSSVKAGVDDNVSWFAKHRARAVADWLKEQGGGSRGDD